MNLKNILKHLVFGIQWGCTFFVAINLIAVLSFGQEAILPADMFIKSALSAVLAGIGSAGGSIVYTFENWSSRKQTVVHFVVGLSTYFLAAYIGQWFKFSFDFVFFITILTSIVIFWIIWFIFYLLDKKDEKSINDKLKKR